MHRIRLLGVLVSLTFLLVAPLVADERQPVSIDDVYQIDGPTDIAIAADGKSAVFIRRWNDRDSRSTRFSLWRAVGSADRAQPLEKGEPDVRRFVLSPNGKWIAFLSTRPRPDGSPSVEPLPPYTDVATDIWLMPVEGGRAVPLTGRGKPYGRVFTDPFYAGLAFSPDGKRLAFVADDGVDPRTPAEIENNVQVVREDQGEGYQGYTAAQIWIADLDSDTPGPAKQIRRITNDDAWYGDPQWAPDGKSGRPMGNRSWCTPIGPTIASRSATASTRTMTCGGSTWPTTRSRRSPAAPAPKSARGSLPMAGSSSA
jgi:Tol biopolymer transport system component